MVVKLIDMQGIDGKYMLEDNKIVGGAMTYKQALIGFEKQIERNVIEPSNCKTSTELLKELEQQIMDRLPEPGEIYVYYLRR